MSSTRHAVEGAPLSQERYMSSPEYAEIRGISGNAVTAKAALLGSPAKRGLLFFLQALSLKEGGLQSFKRSFLEMFPERIGTPTMHRVGIKPGQKYGIDTACKIYPETLTEHEASSYRLYRSDFEDDRRKEDDRRREDAIQSVDDLLAICRERLLEELPGFIIELCINPGLRFPAPGESTGAMDRERAVLREQGTSSFENANLRCFRDVVGALFEYKRRYEENSRKEFIQTEVTNQVFEVLDVCLATGKMVVAQGESRIGKTTGAEEWCNQHLGESRFVTLNGIRNYSGVFRAIAKSLGLASSLAHSTTKVQAKIEDMLQRSRLVLVIDEAHHLLASTERTRTAPELIDWVDTALCNHRVPCALICTPQLTLRMARHERNAGWNADQWRGRVKRFCLLPEIPKSQDLRAVARKLLPAADKPTIDFIVGYALSSKLHMPAVVNAVDESKLIVQREGREEVTFDDVERAILDYCAPSAAAMAQIFTEAKVKQKKGRSGPARVQVQDSETPAPRRSQMPVEELVTS